MRRAVLLAVASATLAACNRDLGVPEKRTLALSPTFTTVAPRETLSFDASGGAGGYTFAFAEGGKLSGPDADVSVTGLYRAGHLGSALDVVEVHDGAGHVVSATVSVGPRVAIAPLATGTAPGGALAFTATGGRGPYSFSLLVNASGATIDPSGLYTAGAAGDVTDVVSVADATGDPAATAVAQVRVSSALRLVRGTPGIVAPREQVAFAAFGGQPTYAFSLSVNGSGGSIDPDTGLYVAGPTGSAVDRVRVRDQFGQTNELDVPVGPGVALANVGVALHPSAPVQLVATGGQPPYTYSFGTWGNRSGGTVEAATGTYTPGANSGAFDDVLVTDALGATATRRLAAVGPLTLAAGRDVQRCWAMDLNGDGRQDAVLFDYDLATGQFDGFTTYALPAGQPPAITRGWVPAARANDRAIVGDFQGIGRGQLAFFGSAGFWTLVPDATGSLGFGPSLPASTFTTQGWSAQAAPIAAVRTATGTRFYTGATCGAGTGIWRFDWPAGASAPTAALTCEPLALGGGAGTVFAQLVATDLNGDGQADLAWIEGSLVQGGPVRWASGSGPASSFPTSFAAQLAIPFQVATDVVGSSDDDAIVGPAGVYLQVGGQPIRIALLRRGAPPTWAPSPTWPYFPTSLISFTAGMALRDPAQDRLAAWDVYGHLVGVDVASSVPTTTPILPAPGQLAAQVRCAAFPDLDGDGVPDLVVSERGPPDALVHFGDGDGAFGRRVRFATDGSPWAATPDVTGDGVPDVIAATATPGVRVLAGGLHQLAYGPETGAPARLLAIAPGRAAPGPAAGLYAIDEAFNLYAAPVSGGAVGALAGRGSLFQNLPTVDAAIATSIDPADPRDDLFIVWRQGTPGSYGYLINEWLTPSTYVLTPPDGWLLSSAGTCAFLPVGRADVAGVCAPPGANHAVLYRSTRSGTQLGSLAAQNTWTGAGGRAAVAAAGLVTQNPSLGPAAVLVVQPSTASPAAMPASAVWIDPGFAWTTTPLTGISEQVTSAALGDVDGDGRPDLLVRAGARLYTFRGAAGGTFVATGSSTQAAGAVRGALPLAGGSAGDGLVQSGSQIVVLPNAGGALP